jgi:hypothetical protein
MGRIKYLTLIILLVFSASIQAQETIGFLEGYVRTESENPISAANIVVTSPQLQGERGTSTDGEGYFRIIALPVGSYVINITHIAYKPTVLQRVAIRLGKTTSLGVLRLYSRVIELPEVEVSGAKSILDLQSTTIGANLPFQTIDQLPVERNFRSAAQLIPQVNASYYEHVDGRTEEANISGSTGQANAYFVDGVNVTDGRIAFGSINLPYNFIYEVEFKTGGYQAEFGRSLGGILNVVTPSGGNEFHGQVFGFFTNDRLGSAQKIAIENADAAGITSQDYGFSLGGPIMRDRLWFYSAYNPNFQSQQFKIPEIGTLQDSKTIHLFAGKLTWRAPGNTDVILSLIGDPSIGKQNEALAKGYQIKNKEVLARTKKSGGTAISLQARKPVSKRVFLSANLSYLSSRISNEAASEKGSSELLFIDASNGTLSGGVGEERDYLPRRFAAKITGSLFLGKHDFKIGLAYEDNTLDASIHRPGIVISYDDTTYEKLTYFVDARVHNRVPTMFIQDSWQATQRLRLNAGLRWDGQYFIGSDRKIAQRIKNQLQPRIGIIYQSGELGTAKLFGSYGRFYEQIPSLFSAVMHTVSVFKVTVYDHNPLVDPSGGDVQDFSSTTIRQEVDNLCGQYFDEFILGYERRFGRGIKLSLRGIYRELGQALDTGVDPETGAWLYGNPGRSNLDFFPKYKRIYKALEVTLQKSTAKRFNFITSYVISRNRGNYTGLFNAEMGAGLPNFSDMPTYMQNIPNSEGLLPNDRTHVFKFSGSYLMDMGLSMGASFLWQSGTPVSELGNVPGYIFKFLTERGSAGRMPAIADLNLRLKYDLSKLSGAKFQQALILDIFHVFNQRKAVRLDQTHYFNVDESGNPTIPNSNYLNPIAFFPARMIRLGMEVNF